MGTKSFLLVKFASWEGEHPEIHHDGIPLRNRWICSLVNDELPGHCAEAVRVPKLIQGACGLCKRGKNEIFMNGPVNQNTRKTFQFFHVLERKSSQEDFPM